MAKTLMIYALGGGWGHLNRSLALTRVATTKYQVKLIVNSSYLSQTDTKNLTNCQIFAISPQANFQQTGDRLKQIINQESFDCLIVDTFPRGLGGELKSLLPNISQPKVLVNRYLNPEYIERYRLQQFVDKNYNLILIPGETIPSTFADSSSGNSLSKTVNTAPWLIRNSSELADFSTAADLLGLIKQQAQQPLIIVLASGYKQELALYGEIACSLNRQGYRVRCLSATIPPACPPEIWRFHYPALECLWLADLVIGSGGYNTIFECQQLNIPLIAIAHRRLYDCQKTRIVTQQKQGKCWLAKNSSMAVSLAQKVLSCPKSKTLVSRSFLNGTKEAIAQIAKLISS